LTKIRILPEILSNKIAAGEVVERPASVVKELVENAIDAQSTRISVEIQNGGRSLIRVSDNGHGMSHDDALLALERYATSKILADADLYAIRTLGFRGEALPSIAAVSRLTLVTRAAENLSGTEISVEGGRMISVKETGAPTGTMITVRQLFYNIPARRKFLKTVATEMGHIAEFLSCMALARPGIQFKLVHNRKTVYQWPAVTDPADRVMAVLGNNLRSMLHPIAFHDEDVGIAGWTSDPSETRSTSQKIHIFVNGRYIKDRGIQYALFEGYHGRIMKGRFPVSVVFVNLPPEQVDVNVHPAKNEVRFADSRGVYDAVRRAAAGVWERQRTTAWGRPAAPAVHVRESISPAFRQPEQPSSPVDGELPLVRTHSSVKDVVNRSSPSEHLHLTGEPYGSFGLNTLTGNNVDDTVPNVAAFPSSATTEPDAMPAGYPSATVPESGEDSPKSATPDSSPGWRFADLAVIGQFRNTYILCESHDVLVVIDQHAVHERIVFERLQCRRSTENRPPVQQLVIPEIIELGFREASVLRQALPSLAALGLDIDYFGGNAFAVKAVPALLAELPVQPLITGISERLGAFDDASGPAEAIEKCLILMACHGAIRARQSLSNREIRELLFQLDACENPFHCPHGRPTYACWPVGTIEKIFKRTG
jgi:DNA mismatch repair protein MutL